ncbi:IMP dehydrogenase, partial [Vibrio parahaemolyticus]
MELVFDSKGILRRGRGLTFDDVLLVPNKSDVKSRKDPNLSSRFTRNHLLGLPLISANMDTVTESAMAIAMQNLKAVGILHRFMTV